MKRNVKIIDMHCDTLLAGWSNSELNFFNGETDINLKLLLENHSLVQFFAMYLTRDKMQEMSSYDILKGMYRHYQKQMDAYRDYIRPVYGVKDVEVNQKEGLLSSLLCVEDGVFLDGKIERLTEVYNMGVHLITLTWNFENSLGFPCSDDPKEHQKGLKPFGTEVVEQMNRMGMMIDVSHLSEGGFYDVSRQSSKPFVASHSCARALCNHRRNLTDQQLRILGEKGGVVGVNFERSFLKEHSNQTTFEMIIKHLLYMKNKAGIEAVGFGSDFDGISDHGELVNYGGFTMLLERMERFFTGDEIDKICYRNTMRVMCDCLGK